MFISPLKAIENGWIKYPEWMNNEFREKCVQPNALDITLDKAFHYPNEFQIGSLVARSRGFELSENHKVMRPQAPLVPNDDNLLEIPTGIIDVMSDFYISVPEGYAASLIIRSTLSRNGFILANGLYDSGFQGHIGFVLHNTGPTAMIEPNTRVAQVYFVESDSCKIYAGGYNTQEGEHWAKQVLN